MIRVRTAIAKMNSNLFLKWLQGLKPNHLATFLAGLETPPFLC